MSKMFRGFGSLAAGVAFVAGLSGCMSQPAEDAALGSLSLPLAAEAQSGARYRLRNATFQIRSSYYWYDEGASVAVSVGAGGYGASGPGGGAVLTIDSEDEDPDATSILVDLEQGSYHVRLLPGWNFEKVEGGTVSEVEATLLSSESIYVYVSPHSTTWAQYKFGIGDSALWLNGKLNVSIDVYEHPDEYYGNGGEGGEGGYGGYGGYGGGYGEGGYEAITSVGVGGYGSSGGAGGGSP